MKLHYELQICILWLNYCSAEQGRVDIISRQHVPRIWNGKPAELGQFPYQVGLMRPTRRNKHLYMTFCGAAIIGKSKVLTGAHCLAADDTRTALDKCFCKSKPATPQEEIDSIRVVAGNIKSLLQFTSSSEPTLQWRTIRSYKFPAKYKFPELDICFIITNKPWKFNNNVGSLPYASKHIDYGEITCTASGFGLLSKVGHKQKHSEVMMWEDFKLLSEAACKKIQKSQMKDFICTDSTYKDVTQGDSGGPLVCKKTGDPREGKKGIIVGVVCGESKYGNFYTRVSSYTKFVDSAHSIACPQFCIFIALTLFLLNP